MFYDLIPMAPSVAMRVSPDRRSLKDLQMHPQVVTTPPQIEWRLQDEFVGDWTWTVEMTRVVSRRARDVLEPALGPLDVVQWLPATVRTVDDVPIDCWVMHFPAPPDIYDERLTVFGPSGLPMRPVLSAQKLAGHEIVGPRSQSQTLVSAAVLTAMRAAGLTGYEILGSHTPA